MIAFSVGHRHLLEATIVSGFEQTCAGDCKLADRWDKFDEWLLSAEFDEGCTCRVRLSSCLAA